MSIEQVAIIRGFWLTRVESDMGEQGDDGESAVRR